MTQKSDKSGDGTIRVAKDFSETPAGRDRADGPFSGERFRREFLVPALKQHSIVTVYLDGTEGYGSSFLEEAFGGLVRVEGFSSGELANSLKLVSEDNFLLAEVGEYVSSAVPR